MSRRRVVASGVGPVSPLGVGTDAYWQSLQSGRNAIGPIQSFDAGAFQSRLAGEVGPLKMADYLPKSYRKRVSLMARDIELAVAAAYLAVRDAGLVTRCLVERGEDAGGGVSVNPARFGANIGAGLLCTDLPELAEALATATDPATRRFDLRAWGRGGAQEDGQQFGMGALTPLWLLKFLPNMLACHVTIVHDCQGPSNTITCGEASSLLCIGEAARTIERSHADISLAGGAESKLNPMGLERQELLGRLSTCGMRPFCTDADGTLISEGGAIIVLEELEHARQRGARIYAELIGFGASCEIGPIDAPSPDGAACARAIRAALRDADLHPAEVDLLCLQGVGIPAYDAAELAAVRQVFGERPLRLMSTKAGQGNNGAGSGALDTAALLLAMQAGEVPPLATDGPLLEQAGGFARSQAQGTAIRTALVVSQALSGGQTAAAIWRRP